MFDAHRHLTNDTQLYDALYATSHQQEWERVALLPSPALGAIGALANRALPSVEEMASFLERYPLVQVGEVGLDRRFSNLERQKEFLLAVLDLAFIAERSVTVHVVQADELFLSCLAQAGKRLPRILWHGFTGSVETAKSAVQKGCIISFGPTLKNTKLSRRVHELSQSNFALETDYDYEVREQEYLQTLEDQFSLAETLLGLDRDTLIRNNRAKRAILTNITPPR